MKKDVSKSIGKTAKKCFQITSLEAFLIWEETKNFKWIFLGCLYKIYWFHDDQFFQKYVSKSVGKTRQQILKRVPNFKSLAQVRSLS